MVQFAELDTEPETLEATLNYFRDNKAMPVSLVGAPGESDKRRRRRFRAAPHHLAQRPAPCRRIRVRKERLPLHRS